MFRVKLSYHPPVSSRRNRSKSGRSEVDHGSSGWLWRLCHVLHLPRLDLLGLHVSLVIGLLPILHLIGRTILPRIGRKDSPLPTSLRLCPGSTSYAAFLLLLLKARRSAPLAWSKTHTTSSCKNVAATAWPHGSSGKGCSWK